MAEAAMARAFEYEAGASAHEDALLRLEALSDHLETAETRRKSNINLRKALKAWRQGNIPRAAKLALRATEQDDTNAKAFHILAMALERMGHRHKAIITYERAFQLDPDDPDLLLNLGLAAWARKVKPGAIRMFELFIAKRPDSALGYNNLACVLADGNLDAAIEVLRGAIYRIPGDPMLWSTLGTLLAEDGRAEESLTFYREALRLDPSVPRSWHNIGYALSHLGMLDEAVDAYDKALDGFKDPIEHLEARFARGVCLIAQGHIEEGFREYEIRNDARFRNYTHHIIGAPLWKGESLQGKRIVLIGEQGLGDELMFANIVPDLIDAVGTEGKVQIAVEKRLVDLFARSFPQAEVGAYDDRVMNTQDSRKELRFVPWAEAEQKPDHFAPMGTPLQFLRKNISDFPKKAFLTPDPARVKGYREQLAAFGPGPYVGICWRSMMMSLKRGKYFSALDMWGPILKTPGVTFVNVQYGDCGEELARAQELHGIPIHSIEGLDLKQDLDGAAALSAALDLVITAPTAAAAIAAGTGTETWFLMAGRGSWPQMGTDEYPWYRATHVFYPERFRDWANLMPKVAGALEAFAAK